MSGSGSGEERTWTIWRCDNCGDFPEVELGEECEFCCEGKQTEFEVVEASALGAEREAREKLGGAVCEALDALEGYLQGESGLPFTEPYGAARKAAEYLRAVLPAQPECTCPPHWKAPPVDPGCPVHPIAQKEEVCAECSYPVLGAHYPNCSIWRSKVDAEGMRIALVTCRVCGATVTLDPADQIAADQQHLDFHRKRGDLDE